jgi:hypothetical protein
MSRTSSLLLLGFAAASLAAAGCDVHGAAANDFSQPTVNNLADVDGGDAGEVEEGGVDGVTSAPNTQGNPLCHVPATSNSCTPDVASTAKACTIAPDGGAYSATAGYDDAGVACRVTIPPGSTTANATPVPTCAPAGTAGDGAWCKTSGECAAAYDCVGAGTCQKYCCAGNAECSGTDFCDIQPTAQASTVVIPVCMPVHPASGCTLLDPSACSEAETCSVVRENGQTSCVAVGGAKVHDPCDEEHCAAGLVCLGAVGQRECYQLCHTASSTECTAPQACKGGLPFFPDPSTGICQ